ncbi:MAG: glycosyltransferase [Candidatus Cloacimonetes bacterium]|nr:glycosyltransferase [Candidatus Cloacimonadota bacterium]
MKNQLRCSIGILIHNEAENIGKLLKALLNQKLEKVEIAEIIVISSDSTDGSDDIVKRYSGINPIVKLITEKERRGKSAAINTFLKEAKEDLILISSGDVIPEEITIEKMIEPFIDSSIGMTGAHPIPVNKTDSFVGYWVHLQWQLHHLIALQSPKLGEMVAFRNIMTSIPEDSAVDEASIEAIITENGFKLFYVPEAIVYNKGPESIMDFIKQRRRIAAGHLWLKRRNSYHVSTNQPQLLLSVLWDEIKRNPWKLHFVILIVILEIWSRFLGWYDLTILKKNPFKWDIINSTKKVN